MAMIRWDPFKEMMNLQDEVRRMMRNSFLKEEPGRDNGEETWSPAVNMYEKDERLIVEVELPGLEVEDVNISIEDDVLHLEGERKVSDEAKEGNALRLETAYGRFERYVPLPYKVDAEKSEAKVCNGMLKMTMPTHQEAKPRQIPVKTA
jgi:HSP20 family protein